MSFDSALAWAVGWLCGAAVLVVLAAHRPRPTDGPGGDRRARRGRPAVRQLDRAGVDARGSTPYFGVAADGVQAVRQGARRRRAQRRPAVPPVPQPDPPHDFGDERPFSRCAAASSTRRSSPSWRRTSAFAPRRAGLRDGRAQRLRLGLRGHRGQVARPGGPCRGRPTRCRPRSGRSSVSCGAHRIAHRDLRLANVFLDDDGRVWLIDFGFSEIAASDLLLATDVAELLASSSVYVGAPGGPWPPRPPSTAATLAQALRPAAALGAQRGDTGGARRRTTGSSTTSAPGSTRRDRRRSDMNLRWLVVAGVGLVIVSLSVAAARKPAISPTEARVFHAVNGLPGALQPVFWAADATRQPRRRHRSPAWWSRSSTATSPSPSASCSPRAQARRRARRPQGDGRRPRRPSATGNQPGRRDPARGTCRRQVRASRRGT